MASVAKTFQQAVGAAAVAILFPATYWRRLQVSQTSGGTVIYVGFDASLSSANGAGLPSYLGWVTIDLPPGTPFYAISTAGGTVISGIIYDAVFSAPSGRLGA